VTPRFLVAAILVAGGIPGTASAGAFEYNASPPAGQQSFVTRYGGYYATYGCASCHTSAPALQAYGSAYKIAALGLGGRSQANVGPALAGIEAADADGDSFTNLEEIDALSAAHGNASIPAISVTGATALDAKGAPPGTAVTYTVNVNNTGAVGEIFDVFVSVASGQPWASSAGVAATPKIALGASSAVTVTVTIPGGAAAGQTSTASFQARSRRNPGVVSPVLSLVTTAESLVDTAPDAFFFAPLVNQGLSQLRSSAAATITGINAPAQVATGNGQHSIGCTGTYTSAAQPISSGQAICLRLATASTPGTTTTATVTIGGVQGTFSATTGPGIVRGDANGDRKADLYWRDASGGLAWWTMDANAITGTFFGIVPPEWVIADVAELESDGRANLLWRRTTDGATYMWGLDGTAPQSFADLGIVPLQWTLVGTGNFDGQDGLGGFRSDILWRHADGTIYIWLMNGGNIQGQAIIGNPGADWSVADIADLDGDGRDDIVFRRAADGYMYLWFMNGLSIASATPFQTVSAVTWPAVYTGDFNGDGKADFLWKDTGGDTWVWLMNGATIAQATQVGNPGASWGIHSLGDFDGDGRTDIVWRHADGTIFLWLMDGASVSAYLPVGNPGGAWSIVGP